MIFSYFQRLGGKKRSSKWRKFRKTFMKGKSCNACGKKHSRLKPLNLHHIEPFYLAPEKELDKNNVIVLCRSCHYKFGHCNLNWKSFNKDVVIDTGIVFAIIKNSQEQWNKKIQNRR